MVRVWKLGLALLLASTAWGTQAEEESVCALVKIEIAQELTLERQGFEAIMQINNALPTDALTHIEVKVNFTDGDGNTVLASSDPDNKAASFYIRQADTTNISAVDGTGELAAGQSAKIRWLIIPAPGAAKGEAAGTLYLVGATLSYRVKEDGAVSTMDVAPDTIYVKPMPELSLDYFLPEEVVGDDAFTEAVEPPVPFSLGVRVRNNGSGVARKVKIDSAQPKIVENNQGLLINFELLGSWVGNQAVTNSLLLDFGDIARASAAVGRWVMQVSLSGHFTEFKAEFRHADELGGQLTSLIKAATTHTLIHDVLLDDSGRDDKRDFLASDAGIYTLYESAGADIPVTDMSAQATLTALGGNRYTLSYPATEDAHLLVLADPFNGQKSLKRVVRSDGKVVKSDNAWLSPHRALKQKVWSYQFSLFDHHSTGQYTLEFEDKSSTPQAPVLQTLVNQTSYEGGYVGFLVEATDPNGDAVNFSAIPLPAGATLTPVAGKSGQAEFAWKPAVGQAGTYALTVTASDGTLYSNKTLSIRINPANDKDGDGMDDAWELAHFKTLDRDGTGDFDNDGISDLDEFKGETDPTIGEPPRAPEPLSPLTGRVALNDIALVAKNITYLGKKPVTYFFELYQDAAMTDKVAESGAIAQGDGKTSWTPAIEWQENRHYYWRVRTYDQQLYSLWREAEFIRDVTNEAPTGMTLQAPVVGLTLSDKQPLLTVRSAVDPDGDSLQYQFLIYAEEARSQLLESSPLLDASEAVISWQPGKPLAAGKRYDWRVVASDGRGLSQTLDRGWFTIMPDNGLPSVPVLAAPAIGSELVGSDSVTLQVSKAADPDGDALSYQFELATNADFTADSLQRSAWLVADDDGLVSWPVSALTDGHYYWRVRAKDSHDGEGPWLAGDFSLVVIPPAPATPTVRNPGNQAWVESLTPRLEVLPVSGKGDYRYRFELFSDAAGSTPVESAEVSEPYWQPKAALQDNSWYYWRVTALDVRFDLSSAPGQLHAFFVNNQGLNDVPSLSWLSPAKKITLMQGESLPLRWQAFDPDSEAHVSLYAWQPDQGEIWDDESSAFSVQGEGWSKVNNRAGFIGATLHRLPAAKLDDKALAQWQMALATPGFYQLQVRLRDRDSVRLTARVRQKDGSLLDKVYERVAQSTGSKADWVSLDILPVLNGELTLQMSRMKATTELVADAVRLVPVATSEQLLVAGLTEQSAEASFDWASITLSPDTYQLAALIEDEKSQIVVPAPQSLVIEPAAAITLDESQSILISPTWSKVESACARQGSYLQMSGIPWYPDRYLLDSDDNLDGVIRDGAWSAADKAAGIQGPGYWLAPVSKRSGASKIVWTLNVPADGDYQLQASWPQLADAAPDARYVITLADGRTIAVRQDQSKGVVGWNRLLQQRLPGGQMTITLQNSSKGRVVADAVRLVALRDMPRIRWQFVMQKSGWYRLDARWMAQAGSAPAVLYRLITTQGARSFIVDQRRHGDMWQMLGASYLAAGEKVTVELQGKGGGLISGDGIRLSELATPVQDGASLLLDNSASGATTTGAWQSVTASKSAVGGEYLSHPSGYGTNSASWQFAVATAGNYRVWVNIPVASASSEARRYRIESGRGFDRGVTVTPKAAGWLSLGEVKLGDGMVRLSLSDNSVGEIAADAVRLEPVE